jgi:hypothetical protein
MGKGNLERPFSIPQLGYESTYFDMLDERKKVCKVAN